MENPRTLPEGTKPPGNVYYFRRFPYAWGVLIITVVLLCCLYLSDSDTPLAAKLTAWTICLPLPALFIIIDPEFATEKQVLNETGCEVTVRRPLIGWKSTEVYVFLDELASGNFDREHGIEDERVRDASFMPVMLGARMELITRRVDDMHLRAGGHHAIAGWLVQHVARLVQISLHLPTRGYKTHSTLIEPR
jgi:hypothetical protein